MSPKGLRHRYGINAVSKGVPLNILFRCMGHTQLSTIAIYADMVGEEEKSIYVRSRLVNRKPWTKTEISHAELVGGAKIVSQMSDRPAIRNVRAEELPYSAKTELAPGGGR